jgi:hypothetical protein
MRPQAYGNRAEAARAPVTDIDQTVRNAAESASMIPAVASNWPVSSDAST